MSFLPKAALGGLRGAVGGIPGMIGGTLFSMIPEIISAFQAQSPEEAQAAIQPHIDELVSQGLSEEQAKDALHAELQQHMEPEAHPFLDALFAVGGMALGGAVGRGMGGTVAKGTAARATKNLPPPASGVTAPTSPAPVPSGGGATATKPSNVTTNNPSATSSTSAGPATAFPGMKQVSMPSKPVPPEGFDPNGETQSMEPISPHGRDPNTPRTAVDDGDSQTVDNYPLNLTGHDTLGPEDMPTGAFPKVSDPMMDTNLMPHDSGPLDALSGMKTMQPMDLPQFQTTRLNVPISPDEAAMRGHAFDMADQEAQEAKRRQMAAMQAEHDASQPAPF